MPRQYLMSWDKRQPRWIKEYKGERYIVTCNELGLPPSKWTKADSAALANEWWISKRAEIDLGAIDPRRRIALEDMQARIEWAATNEPCSVPDLSAKKSAIETADIGEIPRIKKSNPRADKAIAATMSDPMKQRAVVEAYFAENFAWYERANKSAVKSNHDMRSNLDTFFEITGSKQKDSGHRQMRRYLDHVFEYGILPRDASTITTDTFLAHWKFLKNKSWEGKTKNKHLGFFRRFVRWLHRNEVLAALPLNWDDKDHRFQEKKKAIRKFDNVAESIKALPYQYRLWAMLCLNTGMTQADLGKLQWDWIDFKQGTLTRSRVKLERYENAPLVCYRLWPETLKLLTDHQNMRQHELRTGEGLARNFKGKESDLEFVFLSRFGTPMTGNNKDNFTTNWKRYSKCPLPLGKFRHIGSTAIKTNSLYRGFVDYYLANTPTGISDNHYAGESDEAFFPVCDYIKKKLFGNQKLWGLK